MKIRGLESIDLLDFNDYLVKCGHSDVIVLIYETLLCRKCNNSNEENHQKLP